MGTLQAAGVPAAVVQDGRDLLADPQLRERDFFFAVDHPVVGERIYHRFLGASFERWDTRSRQHAPLLDEHTNEMLGELGYSAQEIAELRESGVCGNLVARVLTTGPTLDFEWLREHGGVSAVDEPPGSRWPAVRDAGDAPVYEAR